MPALIGIDLGTTNSLCAVFRDGQPTLIPNSVGSLLTPSVVGLLADERIVVGAAEHRTSEAGPFDSGELLGRDELDRLVANFLRRGGELVERNAAVTPTAEGLLDVSFRSVWRFFGLSRRQRGVERRDNRRASRLRRRSPVSLGWLKHCRSPRTVMNGGNACRCCSQDSR
jgi:hypothetical protein